MNRKIRSAPRIRSRTVWWFTQMIPIVSEADDVADVRGPETHQLVREAVLAELGHLDGEDEQRRGDREDAVGERLQPGGRHALEQRVEPDGQPRRQRAQPLEREQHARDVRLARERVVPDRQQLAVAAEQHLLVRDEARAGARSGSARRRAAARPWRARFPRARPSSPRCAARRSRRAAGTRPPPRRAASSARRRSRSSARRRRAGRGRGRARRRCGEIGAARSDDARHARVESAEDVADDHIRRGEVDRRVGGVELDELVPGRLERGASTRPTFPPRPYRQIFTQRAARTSAGLIPLTAAVNVRSSGPMPAAESARAEAAPMRAPRSRPARPRRSPRSGGRARAARCP